MLQNPTGRRCKGNPNQQFQPKKFHILQRRLMKTLKHFSDNFHAESPFNQLNC